MPLNTYKWGVSEALNSLTLTSFSLLVIPIKGMVMIGLLSATVFSLLVIPIKGIVSRLAP